MHRNVLAAGGALLALGIAPEAALAQSGQFVRPGGMYFALAPFLGTIVVFLLWVRSADWINRDAQRLGAPYATWNLVSVFLFVGALGLFWTLLPSALIGFPVLALAWLGPLIAYVMYHNRRVLDHEKVFTPLHLRFIAAGLLAKVGIKIAVERGDPFEKGTAVKLSGRSGEGSRHDNTLLLSARQHEAFWPTSELLADALNNRADAMMMDVGAEETLVRYQVDGVWHDHDPLDVESGEDTLAVLKVLANLDPEDHAKRKRGRFGIEFKGEKFSGVLACQGTPAGERGVVQFHHAGVPFASYDDLGLREKLQETVREAMLAPKGIVVFSSPPAGGLTATLDVALSTTDRFMRNVASIEDKRHRERDIENITPSIYDSAAGESPETVMERLIRTYPEVIVCRDNLTPATLKDLCAQPDEGRLVVIAVRAREATEALLQPLVMKAPHQKYAEGVQTVVCQRLIRKLCESCKEPVPPPPDVLKQLRLTPEQLETIYRTPQEDNGCSACNGIGYRGRTAIFEVLVVDDRTREILKKKPQLELLRQAARKGGMRTFQEEGLLLVAKGETSLQELVRVLKGK